VLNHLVRGNLLFVAVLRDEPRPEPGTDHLGDDPLAAFRGAAGRLREAFGAPGVLDAVYAAPFGSGPGAVCPLRTGSPGSSAARCDTGSSVS
jgi:hypothetical protein